MTVPIIRMQVVSVLAVALILTGCVPSIVSSSPGLSPELSAGQIPVPSPGGSSNGGPSSEPSRAAGPGRIVFAQFQGSRGRFYVFTMNPDGSDVSVLGPGANPVVALGSSLAGAVARWSPDGQQIGVTTSDSAGPFETIIGANGASSRNLMRPSPTVSLRCLAWSPDALRLICQGVDSARANSAGLYSVRVSDGAGLQQITTYTGGGNDVPGAFSPDGSRIAFVRQTYMVVSLGELWVCDADGSNARKITDTLTGYDVSWSPDGRWIAGDANGALLLFDLTNLGSPPTTITFSRGSASQPRWSPDGMHLVFQFVRAGGTGSEVYVAKVDGSDLHQLTTSPKPDTSPDWGRTP